MKELEIATVAREAHKQDEMSVSSSEGALAEG